MTQASRVVAGNRHSCAIVAGGAVKCWGSNEGSQLGNGTLEPGRVATPADVPGLSGVTALAAGGYHTCALLPGVGVRCWGANTSGELGYDGVRSAVPIEVRF